MEKFGYFWRGRSVYLTFGLELPEDYWDFTRRDLQKNGASITTVPNCLWDTLEWESEYERGNWRIFRDREHDTADQAEIDGRVWEKSVEYIYPE